MEIIYSPESVDDLISIYSYISSAFFEPDTAEEQVNIIFTENSPAWDGDDITWSQQVLTITGEGIYSLSGNAIISSVKGMAEGR